MIDWEQWKLAIMSLGRVVGETFHLPTVSLENVTPNTTTTATTEPFYRDYTQPRLIIGILELILCLIGTPANAIVIYLAKNIIRKREHQENQQLCILSMAMADFLFTSIHSPIMFISYTFSVDLDQVPCRLLYYVTHMCTVASSLSLLCLNCDKFVSLRFPLRYYSILTYRRTKMCLALCWLVSIAWAIFFIFGPYTEFQARCEVYTTEAYGYLAFVSLFFLFPITTSLGISLYVLAITRQARKSDYLRVSNSMSFNNHTNGRSWKRRSTRRGRSETVSTTSLSTTDSTPAPRPSRFKTVTFVFSTTLWSSLTLIPYRIAYLVYHFYDDDLMVKIFFGLLGVMITNATGNAFITIATQYQYRNRIKLWFCSKWKAARIGSDTFGRSAHSVVSMNELAKIPKKGRERESDGSGKESF